MTEKLLKGKYPYRGTIYDPNSGWFKGLDELLSKVESSGAPLKSPLPKERNIFTRDVVKFLEDNKKHFWSYDDWKSKVGHTLFADPCFWIVLKYLEVRLQKSNFRRLRINSEILKIISDYDFQLLWISELIKMREDLFVVDKKDILNFLEDKKAVFFLCSYTTAMSIIGVKPTPDLVVKYAQDCRLLGSGFTIPIPTTFYFDEQSDTWYHKVFSIIREKPELNTNGISIVFEKAPEYIKEEYRRI